MPPMAVEERSENMLTQKQEKFVRNIVEGMSQAEAYRNAYNAQKMSSKTVWVKASQLRADDKVRVREQELRDEAAKKAIMSLQERMVWLSGIVKNDEESTKDRLSANDQLNKIEGSYITKVEGNLNVSKLEDLI